MRQTKAEKDKSQKYEETDTTLGYDMGDDSPGSWVKAMTDTDGGVMIDHSNADGEVVLSPEHALHFGRWIVSKAGK